VGTGSGEGENQEKNKTEDTFSETKMHKENWGEVDSDACPAFNDKGRQQKKFEKKRVQQNEEREIEKLGPKEKGKIAGNASPRIWLGKCSWEGKVRSKRGREFGRENERQTQRFLRQGRACGRGAA